MLLRWTTPQRTTDDREIEGALTAELCRETGARPITPAARLTACTPVRRLAVTSGRSEAADTLPPALQIGPPGLLIYRVQIFNATGHSAGNSVAALAASGEAPDAVTALRVAIGEQGAILEWNQAAVGSSDVADIVEFKRVDLSAPPAKGRKARPAEVYLPGHASATHPSGKAGAVDPATAEPELPVVAHLRAPESTAYAQGGAPGGETAGTVDATAAIGDSYTYTAQRLRAVVIEGHSLELRSQPSAPVTVAMRDTFPPKIPVGLAAISGFIPLDAGKMGTSPAPYVDLSWEPNNEADLAGYRVYRTLAKPDGSPQGPPARLNALPMAIPAYRDVAVMTGQGYIYSVTAVDAAGNESAPSAKAREFISAEAGDPPP